MEAPEALLERHRDPDIATTMPPFFYENQNHIEPIQPATEANPSEPFGITPNPAENFGTRPQAAENDGNVQNLTEPFGSIPQRAENDGTLPKPAETVSTFQNPESSPTAPPPGKPQRGEGLEFEPAPERSEQHTVTVRETARQFEAAGVSRTERSITNWCQANRHGTAKLDCYFDPNERRYFISQASIERAIAEEIDRANRHQPTPAPIATTTSSSRTPDEDDEPTTQPNHRALDSKIRDLEIASRVKDQFINHLEKERDALIDRVESSAHRIGQLETQLIQSGESQEMPRGQA